MLYSVTNMRTITAEKFPVMKWAYGNNSQSMNYLFVVVLKNGVSGSELYCDFPAILRNACMLIHMVMKA